MSWLRIDVFGMHHRQEIDSIDLMLRLQSAGENLQGESFS